MLQNYDFYSKAKSQNGKNVGQNGKKAHFPHFDRSNQIQTKTKTKTKTKFKPFKPNSNQVQTQFKPKFEPQFKPKLKPKLKPSSNPNSNPSRTPNQKYTLAPMQLVTPRAVAIAVAIDTMS